ncbi:MAG: sugar ABC transporter substrate-binding protein [Actinomycetota bacterium]|nr:MAG: sugar ABC transporter substrate-binding protein [Actinomycetota bacterium]
MKKHVGGALLAGALAATVAVAGCGSGTSSPNSSATPQAAGTGAKVVGAKTIGLLLQSKASEYAVRAISSSQEAIDLLGWKMVQLDAQADPQKVVTNLQTFVTQKVDAVMSTAWSADVLRQPLQAANNAKIPVVNVWAEVPKSPLFAGQLGPSETSMGTVAADEFIKLLPKGGPVAYFNSKQFGFGAIRGKILEDKINAAGNIQIVATHQTDYTNVQADTTKALTDILNAHPDIVGLYLDSSTTVPQAVQVLKAKGLCGKVAVVTYYGDLPNLAAVRDGCVNVLVDVPVFPLMWTELDLLAANLANGTPIPQDGPPSTGYPFPPAKVLTITKANVPQDPTKYFDIDYDFRSYFKDRWAKGLYGPTS